MKKLACVFIVLLSMLAACGGSGGSSPAPVAPTATPTVTPVPATPTATPAPGSAAKGVYLDSAIEGIEYTSPSKSGFTNAKGEFDYVVGEEITFKMYGKVINTSKGGSVITPSDMNDIDINKVLNVLMLAQALDEDQNPSNGIKLPVIDWTKVVTRVDTKTMQQWWDAVDFSINANTVTWGSLPDVIVNGVPVANGTDNINIFLRVVYPGRLMVPMETAANHFSATIGAVSSDVLFDLRGKTAISKVTVSNCDTGGDLIGVRTYTFGDTGFTKVGQTVNSRLVGTGSSAVVECFLQAENTTLAYNRADAAASSIPCGPTCTYNQVNQMTAYKPDATKNLPDYVSLTWYNQDTKTITRIKKFVAPNLQSGLGASGRYVSQTWKEVIQFQ